MKRIRLWVRAFFGFSRIETNAFLILIPVTILILFSGSLLRISLDVQPLPDLDKTDSLFAWLEQQRKLNSKAHEDSVVLHAFDPNEATLEELISLGMKETLAARITRYRMKGGRFRKKEDVLKIFGMDTTWYTLANPWMKFPNEPSVLKVSTKQQRLPIADINTADTIQLMNVFGIGPVLARRIITFRDRLGGFISMGQLKEVYGLDSLVVKQLNKRFEVRPGFIPRQLSINDVDFETLANHPYITRRQAQAILAFRSQHGKLDSLGQLREVKLIDANWLLKMQEYLQFIRE